MQSNDVKSSSSRIGTVKYKTEDEIAAYAWSQANKMFPFREAMGIRIDTVEEFAELLFELYMDKAQVDAKTDTFIEYDDEIVSITELEEEEETMDITVSKDSLFYANGILTKNSFALPATLDWFAAIVTNDELMAMGRQMICLLKTRYGDKSNKRNQIVGVDFPKMRYYDIETSDTTKEVVQAVSHKPEFAKKERKSGIPEGVDWG